MATEFVAALGPNDLQRETSMGNDPSLVLLNPLGAGDLRGVSLPRYKTNNLVPYGYTSTFRIPPNITLTTGLTFLIYLTDDGTSSQDPGTKVYIGITVKRLAANETTDVDTAAGTEQFVSVTLSSTVGGIAIGSLAIANANLDSAAVGDLVLVRIRRKGTDTTNDTCSGRAVMFRVEVSNT